MTQAAMPPHALPSLERLVAAIERSVMERCRHLLTLADRSPYSATYGCFDRAYWQYKIKDFPSGMSQEGLYPLALALDGDLFRGLSAPAVAELEALIAAAAAFSLSRQHANGSVDDYFPYEQAAGATAFSLFGILGAVALGRLQLGDPMERRLRRRVSWLAQHQETGRLSNHEALISLCLARSAQLWGDGALEAAAVRRFERLLSWRSDEGWFEEYGGFDVGYETLTFACLLELAELLPAQAGRIAPLLTSSFRLILDNAEPDGCLGGELYARGTWNLFAHGLVEYGLRQEGEDLGSLLGILSARFLTYPTEVRDDSVIQHHLWSDLRTLKALRRLDASTVPVAEPRPRAPIAVGTIPWMAIERTLPMAGHLWVRHGAFLTHVSVGVGGGFRLYRNTSFQVQDTQNVLTTFRGRRRRVWLANAPGSALSWTWEREDVLLIRGRLTPYRPQPMTTFRMLALRLLMICGGRFCANRIRALMQRLLIDPAADPGHRFQRRLLFRGDGLLVEDTYGLPAEEVATAVVTPTAFSTFRHVVMSRVFHPYAFSLQEPLEGRLTRQAGAITVERRW